MEDIAQYAGSFGAIPIPISFNDLHMRAVYLLAYYICSGNLVDINDL